MAKTYKITGNTIISLNDDGSVTRLGEIDSQGKIVGLEERVRVETRTVKETDEFTNFIMWVALIAAGILGYLYYTTNQKLDVSLSEVESITAQLDQAKKDVSSLQSSNNYLQSQIQNLQQQKSQSEQNLQQLRSRVGSTYPLIISDIEMGITNGSGGIVTNYGNTLYSSSTMYLEPKIYYEGISGGFTTLYIKLYKPNGQLSTGSSSPSGYSYSTSLYIITGNNNSTLGGWGSSTRGHWDRGTYRIEIWYSGKCLKTKTFTIY